MKDDLNISLKDLHPRLQVEKSRVIELRSLPLGNKGWNGHQQGAIWHASCNVTRSSRSRVRWLIGV